MWPAIPIPDAPSALPSRPAPLLREHRLYQADWLLRFYGFEAGELVTDAGLLPLAVDPKLAWALAHPERFPVDLQQAPRELMLRVPGVGVRSVDRLLAARSARRLRRADLERLHLPLAGVSASQRTRACRAPGFQLRNHRGHFTNRL